MSHYIFERILLSIFPVALQVAFVADAQEKSGILFWVTFIVTSLLMIIAAAIPWIK